MAPTKKSYSAKKYPTSKSKGYNKKYTSKKYSPAFQKPKNNGPEKKYKDTQSAVTPPIGSAFTVTPENLSAIAQGAGSNSRVGNKVTYKSVQLRGVVVWPGGQVTSSPSQIRYVIVYDKQPNNALAGRSDVFQDGTYFISPINLTNADRFVILADVTTEQCANGQFNVASECFRKMDLEGCFNTSNTIAQTGNLLLFVACNADFNSASTTTLPIFQSWTRVRYTDV